MAIRALMGSDPTSIMRSSPGTTKPDGLPSDVSVAPTLSVDRIATAGSTGKLYSAATLSAHGTAPAGPSDADVAAMNPAQKLGTAIERALPMLPSDVRAKVAGMLTPENLALMGGITAAWAASHAIGVGEVADVVALGIGAITLGPEVVGAAKDFAGFVTGALGATSNADLNGAAAHFSKFVSTVGVDTAAALLLHKAAKAVGPSLDGLAKPAETADAIPTPRNTPQGFSDAQFADFSQTVRDGTRQFGDDVRVHGSRASGTAGPNSDVDVAVRVSPREFNRLLQERFGEPNPGSAKMRTMQHASETGKIQAGEAGLRPLRQSLEAKFGMKVDISIVRDGGDFDRGPWIPLK